MSWTEKKITIDGPIKLGDGYAKITMNAIKVFHELGYEVRANRDWTHTDLTDVPEPSRSITEANRAHHHDGRPQVGLRLSNAESFANCPTPFKTAVALWEFSKLPDLWRDGDGARTNLIFACSKFCQDIWLNAGVKTPIELNQLGVDTELFTYKERKVEDRPFTFLIASTISERKHPWLTWQALRAAFPGRKDVRLIVKSPSWLPVGIGTHPREVPADDDRITVINELWTEQQMVELMHSVDCFVFPTGGEGFGLSNAEAMSTGLPVISTAVTGCLETMSDDSYSYPLSVDTGAALDSHWGDIGHTWNPSFDHLVDLMKHVEANRDEAIEKGRKAAEFIRSKLTWKHFAQRYIDGVNKYL